MADKQLLNMHAQAFIREVMAQRLREEGYVSLNGDDIAWYRLVGGDALCTIYFSATWPRFPLTMDIHHGHHPLFIEPEYPKGIYRGTKVLCPERVSIGRPIFKNRNRVVYRDDISVTCPDEDAPGADILETVLDVNNSVHSAMDCYLDHKRINIRMGEKYSKEKMQFNPLSSVEFMSEIVFWDDAELYPPCRDWIEEKLAHYEKCQKVRKLVKVERKDIDEILLLRRAVVDGDKDGYLRILEERKRKNIAVFKKKTGNRAVRRRAIVLYPWETKPQNHLRFCRPPMRSVIGA